jgi:hypothetical protein
LIDIAKRVEESDIAKRSSDNKTDLTGLKKISSNGFELDIEEKDNHVEISSDHFNKRIDLEIKVPTNFSLELGNCK